MKYRKFGALDWQCSVLGFGAMRMPTKGAPKDIDYPEAMRMLRHAIDNGVNYVDTGYPYHGGASETFLGEALKDGYRDKVKLATKLLVRIVEKREDIRGATRKAADRSHRHVSIPRYEPGQLGKGAKIRHHTLG